MPPLTIPYLTGRIAVLGDLLSDHYARQKLGPFSAHRSTAGPITDFSAAFHTDLDTMIRRHQPEV